MAVRRARLSAVIIAAGVLVMSSASHAQKLRKAGKIAKLAVERTRRGIALGPWIGGVAAIGLENGDVDGAISFGAALMFFHVPVLPDSETIKQMLKQRFQARLFERIKQVTLERGKPPSKKQIKDIAREIRDAFLEQRKPKLLEKPRFAINVESARFFRSDAWEFRITPSWGIGPIFVGPTLMTRTEPDTALYIGPEIHLALTPGSGPRSPVVDVFLRTDFALGGANTEHLVSGGVRFVLDVI